MSLNSAVGMKYDEFSPKMVSALGASPVVRTSENATGNADLDATKNTLNSGMNKTTWIIIAGVVGLLFILKK